MLIHKFVSSILLLGTVPLPGAGSDQIGSTHHIRCAAQALYLPFLLISAL